MTDQEDEKLEQRLADLAKEIGERIATIRGKVPRPEFAKSIGIHKNTLIRYETGKRLPDAEFIVKMNLVHKTSPLWLLQGLGVIRRSPESVAAQMQMGESGLCEPSAWPLEIGEQPDEYAYLPLYDVHAAAGHGAVVESEQVIDSLAFKREWINSELHANASDLYLIYVEGESMGPTLRPGDIVLVDRRDQTARRDGIYVLSMGETLLVKRLQSLPGGQIKVSSDNPAYEAFFIDKQRLSIESKEAGNGASIIGRVIWSGRRM